jgi:hypothetical protein
MNPIVSNAPTGRDVLAVPMAERNDAGAADVRGYLVAGFSGKRPFGNSSWPWDLYSALGKADLMSVTWDDDGYIEDCDQAEGDRLIHLAIQALGETR